MVYKKSAAIVSVAALSIIMSSLSVPVRAQKTDVHQQTVDVAVRAQHHAKMPLLIGIIGNTSAHAAARKDEESFAYFIEVLKRDLEFSGQFAVSIQSFDHEPKHATLQALASEKFPLALFVTHEKKGGAIQWRLYDTQQALMVLGKRSHKLDGVMRGWAHGVADELWPALTGHDGFFSTKIAYAKEVRKQGRRYKYIAIADYDGTHEELLVTTPTINLAPRWNHAVGNPLLFYSESTNTNVRLMWVNMAGKRKVASGFDGINMVPAFSGRGDKVVYCASRGMGMCQLYLYANNGLKMVTNNSGNNVSPTLSSDGNKLFFCSDFQGQPHIYQYDFATKAQARISEEPFSFCPSYWDKGAAFGKLAYTKIVRGVTQLFLYDEKTHTHRQLTFDGHNKDECSWSPCGNYILYSVSSGGKNRLAILNTLTGTSRSITAAADDCSYPTWSPRYAQFPVVAHAKEMISA